MTVPTTANRISYAGNGVTAAFSFPYKFFVPADVVVLTTVAATGIETTLVLNSDYTISGSQDSTGAYPNGATFTLSAPATKAPTGNTLTFYRNPSPTQLVQHEDNDPLPALSIDNPLDLLTCLVQRCLDLVSRSIVLLDGDPSVSLTLPNAVQRANNYLAFDSNGNVTTAPPVFPVSGNTYLTNNGASGPISFNLPPATNGLIVGYLVVVANTLTANAIGTDTIRTGTVVSAAGGNVQSAQIGSIIELICIVNGQWVTRNIVGDWNVS